MTQDLIELLDRQFSFLLRQEGATFLRELRRTFVVLQREPRIAALLDDERRSAIQLVERFEKHEQHFLVKLVTLRNELVSVAPDLDDSGVPPPSSSDATHVAWWQWFETLGAFDAIVSGRHFNVLQEHDRDQSQTASLIAILCRKLSSARWTSTVAGQPRSTNQDQRPELDSLQQRLDQLQSDHIVVWRPFYDGVLTEPGAHLLYIEELIANMSRSSAPVLKRNSQLSCIIQLLRLPTQYSFTSLLYERLDQEGKEVAKAAESIAVLRGVVDRIHQGLRLRVGTTRSLLALFNRFRTRCQFHDRARLLRLAESARGAPSTEPGSSRRGTVEQTLTAELALYLFDQGLNPLTEVPAAGLRPDVLEPGSLYVEAKQYESGNPRSYLITGARQVHETMGRLRGSHYQVHEAFYVVFRLGGPHVTLPEMVPCGDWTLYPLLIDLAPASESGSRARESIVITVDDFRPRADALPA